MKIKQSVAVLTAFAIICGALLWTSGPLAPGESWSLMVTESADYFCSIHVVMKGKLIVQ